MFSISKLYSSNILSIYCSSRICHFIKLSREILYNIIFIFSIYLSILIFDLFLFHPIIFIFSSKNPETNVVIIESYNQFISNIS